MRQAVPIFCTTASSRHKKVALGWSTVDIRDVEAAAAPPCVRMDMALPSDDPKARFGYLKQPVELRNFEGRYWRPSGFTPGPETTEISGSQRLSLLNHFNGNYEGHPLYPNRYDFGLLTKRGRTDTIASDEDVAGSPMFAAIDARSKSMIAIDGQTWIASPGPVLQAHPHGINDDLTWSASASPLTGNYKDRLYAFGLGEEDIAVAVTSEGLGRSMRIVPDGAPEFIGELPPPSRTFAAGALEVAAWNIGWCLSEARKETAEPWQAAALGILRDVLEPRGDLAALTRGKLYISASWPYDWDQLDFQDPSDLAYAFERIAETGMSERRAYEMWMKAALSRIRHGMTNELSAADIDAIDIATPKMP